MRPVHVLAAPAATPRPTKAAITFARASLDPAYEALHRTESDAQNIVVYQKSKTVWVATGKYMGGVETSGGLRPLPLRTRKFVLAITVKDACHGDTSFQWHKTNQNAPKGVKQKQGIRCRACSNSSGWAAGRSNRRIGRNSWLDRPSRLPGY